MEDFDIRTEDVVAAKDFLRAVLQARVGTSYDLSPGSILGDALLGLSADLMAFFRRFAANARQRSSLRRLSTLETDAETIDATDAILSNFYAARDPGAFSKGIAIVFLTQRVTALIPRTTRFFRSDTAVFYPDSDIDLTIAPDQMRPVYDTSGAVQAWTARVPVVAARVGTDYNFSGAGTFVRVDRFSPYFDHAEHADSLGEGRPAADNTAAIASVGQMLALRAMVNARGNAAVLAPLFPETAQSILTIGAGEPEMNRDVLDDQARTQVLHLGGKTDIYVAPPLVQRVARVQLNTLAARPDDGVLYLRDTAPPSGSFVTAGVRVGDILRVRAGLPDPMDFRIDEVSANSLRIAARTPFVIATDELAVPPALSYSVGFNAPDFNSRFTVTSAATARTSRKVQYFNGALLPAGPIYRITSIELLSAPSALDAYRDPLTGTVRFVNRSNSPVVAVPTPGTPLKFYAVVETPTVAQSMRAVGSFTVGWPAVDLTGYDVDVAYETVQIFPAVHTTVADPFQRTASADTLVRARHPVYVSAVLPYRLRPTATVTFDPVTAAQLLADTFNTDSSLEWDAASIQSQATQLFQDQLSTIYPLTLRYELIAPDGKVYRYASEDLVTLYPDADTSTARLLNPAEVGLPNTGYTARLRQQLLRMGVSDRTCRRIVSTDGFVFERRGV